MEGVVPNDSGFGIPPLPIGLVQCEGLRRSLWITKCVTLKNDEGVDVAQGICNSVDADLVVDSDGKPLGDNRVAIQIAESLCEEVVPSEWMFSMHSWPITRVYLNGASLHDHEQMSIYKSALNASQNPIRLGTRPYDSSRQRKERNRPTKKEYLTSTEAINGVASIVCCARNCLQPFPRSKIQALRAQMYLEGDVYFRKHRLLDVHTQIHQDVEGKELITLEGIDVCPIK